MLLLLRGGAAGRSPAGHAAAVGPLLQMKTDGAADRRARRGGPKSVCCHALRLHGGVTAAGLPHVPRPRPHGGVIAETGPPHALRPQ